MGFKLPVVSILKKDYAMKLPNIKSYVIGVLKPHLKALSDKYSNVVTEISKISHAQNSNIQRLEARVTEMSQGVADLSANAIEVLKQANEANKNLPTAEEVKTLKRRVQELNYIEGHLYDKYWELINTGKVEDPWVPDFDNTWIPGDPVLTDEELEAEWRALQEIAPDVELTPEQKVELDAYITEYRKHHPSSSD